MEGTEVTISGVSRVFSDGTGLQPIDLHIQRGEFVSILGPSGCGKSTLLRCLAGLETPDTGTISLGERTVSAPGQKPVPANRRRIGMVFQDLALWPHLSLTENVAFPLRVSGAPKKTILPRVEGALARVGMSDFAQKMPHQLSGGQQQRVAIARAVVAEPELLLMDEPFSALDAALRTQLRMELVELTTRLGLTTLYVTHDQEEAMAVSQRIVVMRSGVLQQFDTPETLYQNPATEFVAEFVGRFNRLPAGWSQTEGTIAGVRPENVTITGALTHAPAIEPVRLPGALQLDAETLSCIYTGGRYLIRCKVHGTDPWLVESPDRYEPGAPIRLSVDSTHLLQLT
ncbi:ABC transporter ATP-binding protein [Nesterenkonia sp. MY13]|uniref:ABC-type quaternary amine transporter n=1 Tax=Nesterenkonia sedimenti TaxID=1463632 RepID=A0A7X8YDW6_9MICC|nr:ABC transporter ATP-binding protein [Nesterenkonia sedimenti]